MACWLVLRAYQTVLYRIILQKKIHFLHNFLQNSFQNFFKLLFLYIFFIFCNLKKIKSNSLVTVWNALGLSQQTTVSLNYSQSIKINIGPSDGGTIISSSRRPTVIYQRLTEFKTKVTWAKNSEYFPVCIWLCKWRLRWNGESKFTTHTFNTRLYRQLWNVFTTFSHEMSSKLRWSTCPLAFSSWLLDHVIYQKWQLFAIKTSTFFEWK